MTYNHPKRNNCDRGSYPVLNVRMCMYVHHYMHKCSTWNIVRTIVVRFPSGYRQRRLMSEAT